MLNKDSSVLYKNWRRVGGLREHRRSEPRDDRHEGLWSHANLQRIIPETRVDDEIPLKIPDPVHVFGAVS